ncbi:MAG: hypothetical protein K0R63_1629 [Rickettsiales bacterium]|jgi:hypothetical protein|nr:hypothetical protein [Rickettsiales bacterium]
MKSSVITYAVIALLSTALSASPAFAACKLKSLGFGKGVEETAKKYHIPATELDTEGDTELQGRGQNFCAEFPENTTAELLFREGKFVQVQFMAIDSGTTIYDIINGQISESLKKPNRSRAERHKKTDGDTVQTKERKRNKADTVSTTTSAIEEAEQKSSRSGFQDIWSDKKYLLGGYSQYTNTNGSQVESLVISSRKYQKLIAARSIQSEEEASSSTSEIQKTTDTGTAQ